MVAGCWELPEGLHCVPPFNLQRVLLSGQVHAAHATSLPAGDAVADLQSYGHDIIHEICSFTCMRRRVLRSYYAACHVASIERQLGRPVVFSCIVPLP